MNKFRNILFGLFLAIGLFSPLNAREVNTDSSIKQFFNCLSTSKDTDINFHKFKSELSEYSGETILFGSITTNGETSYTFVFLIDEDGNVFLEKLKGAEIDETIYNGNCLILDKNIIKLIKKTN